MAKLIRANPDLLRNRAKHMRTEAEKMATIISCMDAILIALCGEWEGSASDSFVSYYEEIKPHFRMVEDHIWELAVSLERYAGLIEELDASLA